MKMIRYQPQLLLCVLLFVAETSLAKEPLWHFTAGQTLRYRVTQETAQQLDAGDFGNLDQQVSQTTDVKLEVLSIKPKGAAEVRCVFERIQMQSKSAFGDLAYDSASDEPPQGAAAMIAPTYRGLLVEGFTAVIAGDGRVEEIKLPEELAARMQNIPGAGESDAGELSLRVLLEAITIPQIREGEPADRLQYRFVERREQDGATVAIYKPMIDGLKLDGVAPGATQPLNVTSAKATGEAIFDLGKGKLLSSEIDQRLEVQVTIDGKAFTGVVTPKIGVEALP